MYHNSEAFSVIDAILLLEAFDYLSSFMFHNFSCRFSFVLIHEPSLEHFGSYWKLFMIDYDPGVVVI